MGRGKQEKTYNVRIGKGPFSPSWIINSMKAASLLSLLPSTLSRLIKCIQYFLRDWQWYSSVTLSFLLAPVTCDLDSPCDFSVSSLLLNSNKATFTMKRKSTISYDIYYICTCANIYTLYMSYTYIHIFMINMSFTLQTRTLQYGKQTVN